MDKIVSGTAGATAQRTSVKRTSELDMVVTRSFNAPAHIVFKAWTNAELFRRWWVPRSLNMNLLSCELDVRVGGSYRLVFAHPQGLEPMAFHGRYLEVIPNAKIVWTNEESGENGQVTTVTFEEKDGKTLLVMHDHYPSAAALEEGAGNTDTAEESFSQLDEIILEIA